MKQYLDQIQHDAKEREGQFYIDSAGKHIAQLDYKMMGTSKMIITHTEVGGELKGTEAGKALVFKAAYHARSEGWRVLPLCPFAKVVFKRYEEIQDVVVEK